MNILIFSQYYHPEQFLVNDIAPELVRRGHRVTVITGRPNYPRGKVFEGYEGRKRERETIDGVEVTRCPITPRGTNKVQLLANYFSYMRLANKTAKKLDGQFDVVYLYQLTPIMQAYPAIKYAQRNHVGLVCYCLDLAPLSGNEVAAFLKPMHWLYKRFARWAYQHCDQIAVTSKDFIGYLNETHDIPLDRLVYLPQHADEKLLHADLTKKETDGVVDFMFAGNIGEGAKLECVIQAVEQLKVNGLHFRLNIVGDGSAKAMLEELVDRLQLSDYVKFHGRVPMSEMEAVYRKADALTVTLRKGQITMPGKVQAYMATGKPILGAMDGSGKQMIEEVGCGMCVAAEDVEGIAQMMESFVKNPDAYTNAGKKGREYFEGHFRLATHVDQLEKLLK